MFGRRVRRSDVQVLSKGTFQAYGCFRPQYDSGSLSDLLVDDNLGLKIYSSDWLDIQILS